MKDVLCELLGDQLNFFANKYFQISILCLNSYKIGSTYC